MEMGITKISNKKNEIGRFLTMIQNAKKEFLENNLIKKNLRVLLRIFKNQKSMEAKLR